MAGCWIPAPRRPAVGFGSQPPSVAAGEVPQRCCDGVKPPLCLLGPSWDVIGTGGSRIQGMAGVEAPLEAFGPNPALAGQRERLHGWRLCTPQDDPFWAWPSPHHKGAFP